MSEYLIKKLAKLAAKQLLASLVKRWAFFAWGPFPTMAAFLLEKVLIKVLEETWIGMIMAYVHLDTARDLARVKRILKDIEAHKGDLTKEEIEKYDNELYEAARDLIRFDTIRP